MLYLERRSAPISRHVSVSSRKHRYQPPTVSNMRRRLERRNLVAETRRNNFICPREQTASTGFARAVCCPLSSFGCVSPVMVHMHHPAGMNKIKEFRRSQGVATNKIPNDTPYV